MVTLTNTHIYTSELLLMQAHAHLCRNLHFLFFIVCTSRCSIHLSLLNGVRYASNFCSTSPHIHKQVHTWRHNWLPLPYRLRLCTPNPHPTLNRPIKAHLERHSTPFPLFPSLSLAPSCSRQDEHHRKSLSQAATNTEITLSA